MPIKNYTFSGTGSISSRGSLTISGTGTLTLGVAGSYSMGTLMNNGVLTFNTGGNLTGPVTTAGGAVNTISGAFPGAVTVNGGTVNSVSGAFGGTVTIAGGTVSGATSAFASGVNLNSGVLVISTSGDFSVASSPVNLNGGTIKLTGVYVTGSGVEPWVFNSPNGGAFDVQQGFGSSQFGANPSVPSKQGNSISGSGPLTISSSTGQGAFNIGQSASTFTGTTTVASGAILRFTSNQFGSAGSITVQSGGTYMLYDTTSGPYNLGTGATLSLNGTGVILPGTGVNGSNVSGAFMHVPDPGEGLSPSYAINMPVVLQTGARITELNAAIARGYTGAGTTTDIFTGAITGPGNLIKDGDGIMVISNNSAVTPNSYGGASGITIVSNGTLRVSNGGSTTVTLAAGGTNILPSSTTLQLGEVLLANSGSFDLFGNSQTVAGLTAGNTNAANQIVNSNAASALLVVNLAPSANQTFTGVLGGGASNNNFAFTLSGSGALMLTSANTYTGATTIAGGILTINGSLANTAVTVATGATLRGLGDGVTTGLIGGSVSTAGGDVWPGNATGLSSLLNSENLSVSTLNLSGGKLSTILKYNGGGASSYAQKLTVTAASGTSVTLGTGSVLSFTNDATFAAPQDYLVLDASANPAGFNTTFAGFAAVNSATGQSLHLGTDFDIVYKSGAIDASEIPQSSIGLGTNLSTAKTQVYVRMLNSSVTPVKVDRFTASPEGAGVLLSWNCVSEFQNAGFNLYRQAVQGTSATASGATSRSGRALIRR